MMRRRGLLGGLLAGLAAPRPAYSLPRLGPSRVDFLGTNKSPTLNLGFMSGVLDPRISFARAGVASYFDATGVLQSAAANVPRFDYGGTPGPKPLGLFVEDARTNVIRNPRLEGSVVGTPGTLPTNYGTDMAGSVAVAGIGVENNMNYNDFTLSGSSLVAGSVALYFDAQLTLPVVVGQTYTVSSYVSYRSGSLAGMTLSLVNRYYTSAGTFVSQTLASVAPGAGGLVSQRFSSTDIAPATAAFCVPAIRIATTGAYNVTIRIGGPQLEVGGLSSLILPPAGTPGASSRSADIVSMSTSSFWETGSGTLEVDGIVNAISPTNIQYCAQLDDGGVVNRAIIRNAAGPSGAIALLIINGSVIQYTGTNGHVVFGGNVPFKSVLTWQAGRQASGFGGVVVSASPPGALVPANATTLRIGCSEASNQQMNGYMRGIQYWPRSMPDSELRQRSL